MMQSKAIKTTLALLMLAGFTTLLSAAGIRFQTLTLAQAKAKAKKENKLLFVDVYATWCGPCRYLERNVFTDPELGKFYNEEYVCIRLDGEKRDGNSVMLDYDLEAFPTMLIIEPDGTLKGKKVGVHESEDLLLFGKRILDPASAPSAELGKRFQAGERGKEFLEEYADALIEEDGDLDPVLDAWLEEYPELDLDEEMDFLVFFVKINDMEHPTLKKFFAEINDFEEEYDGVFGEKMLLVIDHYVMKAVDEENPEIFRKHFPAWIKVWETADGYETPTREELNSDLTDVYEEYLAEK